MNKSGYSIGAIDLLTKHIENKRINRFWTLVFIRNGAGMYLIDGRLTCLNENDLLFLPPSVDFSFDSKDLGDEYNESLDAVVFRFNERWLNGFLETFHTFNDIVLELKAMKNAVSIHGPKWLRISSTLASLGTCEPHKEAVIILELLGMLADPKDTVAITDLAESDGTDTKEKLERIDRYISCHLTNGFTLEDIAGYAGMNRTYFCLFFKKHYKAGLIEYVNRLKIEQACSLLAKTDLPVSDISKECGFANVTYFNRVFKAQKGISPKEYRIKFIS